MRENFGTDYAFTDFGHWGMSPSAAPVAGPTGTVRFLNAENFWADWSPYASTALSQIRLERQVYDSLVDFPTSPGDPQPVLATAWREIYIHPHRQTVADIHFLLSLALLQEDMIPPTQASKARARQYLKGFNGISDDSTADDVLSKLRLNFTKPEDWRALGKWVKRVVRTPEAGQKRWEVPADPEKVHQRDGVAAALCGAWACPSGCCAMCRRVVARGLSRRGR